MRISSVFAGIGLVALAFLSACGEDEALLEDQSAEEIYQLGESLFADSPLEAATTFEELERIHPYSPQAKAATLRASEAYYQAGNFDEAILASERFLDSYPGDASADRAQFIIARSHYDQITDVERDQSSSSRARQELQTLIQRFPNSEYVQDARLMLDATNDQLAGKEMEVGRFYLSRGHYLAAANRFRVVVDDFPHTSHVAEALHRLVETNLALGLGAEARRAAVVLGYNFPGSDWYRDSYDLLMANGAGVKPDSS